MIINEISGVVKGSYGLDIYVLLVGANNEPVSIVGFDEMEVHVRRPGYKDTLVLPVEHVTDGTDGRVQFAFEEGDLDRPGTYEATFRFSKAGALALSHPVKIFVLPRVGV